MPRAAWGRAGRSRLISSSSRARRFTLADIEGAGAIQQIWMTLARGKWRHTILRVYWDDQEQPSVECPVGDFFCLRLGELSRRSRRWRSASIPGRAFNCYWEMPFRKRARITMTNLGDETIDRLLPDQLHADRRAGRLRLFPRAIPPHQSAALQGRLHDPRRREGPRPLCRHLHGLGREQHRLVGRRRDQVLHGRRRRIPDHLRHRHRGLFLRRVQLRSRHDRARPSRRLGLCGIHHALCRPAAGDPPRRRLQVADSASACIAGISWIPCASRAICA